MLATMTDQADPSALAFSWGPCLGSLPLLTSPTPSLWHGAPNGNIQPKLPLVARVLGSSNSKKVTSPSPYSGGTLSEDRQESPPARLTFRGLTYVSENVVRAHYGDVVRASVHKKILGYKSRPKLPVSATVCLPLFAYEMLYGVEDKHIARSSEEGGCFFHL